MEFLFELLFELIFEGATCISSNKKISKLIRYPLILIIVLFFLSVIFGLLFLGIILLKENILAGCFTIAISILLFILSIVKFKKIYLKKVEEDEI